MTDSAQTKTGRIKRKIKKARFALPNLVTLGSVFCSFLSMSFVLRSMAADAADRIELILYAAIAIIGSIVFDAFDGKVARWTHTSSKFGMELDSLADGVSFGVAPAILVYGFALHNAGVFGLIACFLFISATLLRLARFNIEAPDEGVQTYFKGIPAPAGAACLAATVIAAININFIQFSNFELNTFACLVILVGFLMVSTVKYKTLKGKKTKGDLLYVGVGVLFFAVMCFVYNPSIAFFLLVCYFVAFGMLNTAYLSLKKSPRRHRRHSLSKTDVVEMNSEDENSTDSKDDAKKDAKDENAKKDVKDENAKKDAKDENAKKDAKDENAKKDAKDENAKD